MERSLANTKLVQNFPVFWHGPHLDLKIIFISNISEKQVA